MRSFHKNKKAIYPYDGWSIIEEGFIPENNYRNETIFSLGNGYLGMRGNIEEGFINQVPGCKGTYINGFYESEAIIYGEFQYGFPLMGQTMLNIMDTQSLILYVDGDRFTLDNGILHQYYRVLHMKEGKITRNIIWESPLGKKLHMQIEKFISFENQNIIASRIKIKALNNIKSLKVTSILNGNVSNENLREKAFITLEKGVQDDTMFLQQQTKITGFSIACGIKHRVLLGNQELKDSLSYSLDQEEIMATMEAELKNQEELLIEKLVFFEASRRYDKKENVLREAVKGVEAAGLAGYQQLLDKHQRFLKEFWERADVKIKGDDGLQQGIRFNILQLLQSTGRDGYTNVAAKGLTGEGYEGHYFWDTETYILPFFLYNNPDIARALIMYRYHTLDAARARAREMDHPGALYPWRTIGGEETSAYFEASTAQYHINADIVYAIKKYYEATMDKDLLIKYGTEIVWETARLWADRGGFIPLRGNKFCIHEVTGPDEYKPGVDNNCYTNYMAQDHLYFAVNLVEWLKGEDMEAYSSLRDRLQLKDEEIELWKRAADNMYLPYNEELGINPQDDTFIYKEPYDIENIPVERLPLVFNWHPLNIWRYQICKQADVMLLMLLQSEKFPLELKKTNFDYYEPKTTHDSSLSASIFSVIASEIGYNDYAYNYFMQTARMDLDDYNNNVHKGIHTACMAGAWMCIVNGFAGMRIQEGEISFKPQLPDRWQEYSFKIYFRGSGIEIKINKTSASYLLLEGEPLEIKHNNLTITVTEEEKSYMI